MNKLYWWGWRIYESAEYKEYDLFMSDDYKRMKNVSPSLFSYLPIITSLPIYKQTPFNKSKIWKRKTYRQTETDFWITPKQSDTAPPLLFFSNSTPPTTLMRCGFLSVLASIPCFLEKGALGRCTMDSAGSVDCHWIGTACTTRTPWRSTPWVSTLRVAALRLPSIHRLGPAQTTRSCSVNYLTKPRYAAFQITIPQPRHYIFYPILRSYGALRNGKASCPRRIWEYDTVASSTLR